MEFHEIKLLLEHPAARLLRGENAPMVLGFFYRVFKTAARVAISEGELRALLERYLDELRSADPLAFPQSAREYLGEWSHETRGFLHVWYPERQTEPVYALGAGAEKALLWMEQLREQEFVGAESRLEAIFQGLEEILKYSSGDAEDRIAKLLEESDRIHAEIARIRATGVAQTFTPVQINERFARVIATARELLSDFRQVEENLQDTARDIAERHTQPGVTKGAIVGHMLDSYHAIRNSPQGQSFYGFWNLLLAPDRQSRFEEMLDAIGQLDALHEEYRRHRLLKQLVSRLLAEGEKVVESNNRLSGSLRRVLETTHLAERRRVLELIREVKACALKLKESPPQDDAFLELDHFPELFSAMSRELWTPADATQLDGKIEVADNVMPVDELRRLRNLPQIQLRKLEENVATCLKTQDFVSLPEVLALFPPRHGVVEVLGYLIVAERERRHHIFDDRTEIIEMPPPSRRRWRVPTVLFNRA